MGLDKSSARQFEALVLNASKNYGLPPALIKAVIHVESAYVKDAVSIKGAQGLMQLIPETADDIGVNNPFDPKANIFGGSKLIKRYLIEFTKSN
jgi:soluble lytic murein transglycosylase-like protein